ncbi:unnamed protein product [Mesocestoides corti]|uniref:Major facilitator superfamily (MFS) profile domain-containing protein n=1 Tax=Mesocestoides corti TaxID=53468 RepID=A0A0R3UK96_MESCO|nr:unnamed protein product [Mesocestoides corti]
MLTRLTVEYGLGPYIATYCILFGIGMGLPYSLIFSIASSWFPQHRATVVGIISSGFGLGALVFTPIQTAIINPNNLNPNGTKFPPSVEEKIPSAFLILGGIVLALEVIACILLRQRPSEKAPEASEPDGDSKAADKVAGDGKLEVKTDGDEISISKMTGDNSSIDVVIDVPRVPRSYTTLEALKSVYGGQSKFDDQFLSAIATTSSAFNCVGRVFWGFVVDHLSSKCPLMTFLLLWAALFITFPYVAANEAGKYLYAIWVFGLFFSLSAHFVVIPATCTRAFGPANMATIYGFIYMATCPSALITAAIVSQFDIQGKWVAVYTACGCSCLVSFIIALFTRDSKAHCVGFTNTICASLCDPCRRDLTQEDEEEEEGEGDKQRPTGVIAADSPAAWL